MSHTEKFRMVQFHWCEFGSVVRAMAGCPDFSGLGKLGPERDEILADVGFNLDLVRRDTWPKRIEELKKYKIRHGDCNVPKTYKESPNLGQWVVHQRVLWKNRKLDPEREKTLADLGFDFENTKGKMKGKKGKQGKTGKEGAQAAKKSQKKAQLPQRKIIVKKSIRKSTAGRKVA